LRPLHPVADRIEAGGVPVGDKVVLEIDPEIEVSAIKIA
jgi:hypothetical protein